MPTLPARQKANREAVLAAMKKAIALERRALYADFQGRRSTFSRFMRQTAERLSREYPRDHIWVTLRGLFREYPNLDVGTRIAIVKRAEDLMAELVQQTAETSRPEVIRNQSTAGPASPQGDERTRSPKDATRYQRLKQADSMEKRDPPHIPGNAESQKTREVASKETQPASNALNSSPAVNPKDVSVQFVKGVGPKVAAVLLQLKITTVENLLRHYPRKHLDFQNRLKICELQPGQEVTILGVIRSVGAFQSKRGNLSILTIVVSDGTGSVNLTRFIGGKSNKYLLDRYKDQFPKGCQVLASGIVERDQFGKRFSLKNGEIEILGFGDESGVEGGFDVGQHQSVHTGRLVPVYPLTEGLSLRHLRTIIYNALQGYGDQLVDALPEVLRQQFSLIDLRSAIETIHFPQRPEDIEEARRRLVFDELFAVQLQMAIRRHKFDQTEGALTLKVDPDGLVERLKRSLAFRLTAAQERVFGEIARDLASPKPMHRLVQGDVGSGKTVVALMAALVAIDNGYQAVVMAPTEILAEQHHKQFQRLITPLGLRSALVLGKQGAKERRQIRQEILSGQIHITVGTHALLEEDVEFSNLGLIVIDEQHRFGVKQRARLKAKSQSPELLTMTATPIPRTLALTIHGDLDVSEIDELPPGRRPIETKIVAAGEKKELWEFIRSQVKAGRQAYIVFPLIEESETLAARAATQEFEQLKEKEFKSPEYSVGLMHGKLKQAEKDEVMDDFRAGKYHILVCTTVIEVGVDVPNASVMVIENADRFGLAQLHQLRGRVGRGNAQSYCFLATDNRSPNSRQRLAILTQTNDGFVIAEKDLEIRGPGEFLGVRQSGLPDLLLADLVKDAKILEEARRAALELVRVDPELKQYPLLLEWSNLGGEHPRADVMRSG
jgi:ATP-dependent DNA helicase RecG